MAQFIGIDLGTTFSAVSTLDETGRPQVVRNADNENIVPSCVTEIDGKYVVGKAAWQTWAVDPESGEAAARFKRDMGADKTHGINDKEFTPTELSVLVLKKLVQDAAAQIGEIGEAVVTVPANFGNKAREATMSAAKKAGLNVRFIINEPTAAALYYAFKEDGGMHGVYAVYDLGGGTFDVSIIRVDGHDVEVLATNGVRKLGGDDFDRALRKIVFDKYRRETGEDAQDGDYTFDSAEDDKKALSKGQNKRARVNRENIAVSREEFEEAISSLVAQAEMLCESVMEEAKVAPSDIREVLLAGGSTRIPMIRESIKRVFQREPVASANVDEVVSLGAVLYAAIKGDQSQLSALQKKSIQKIAVAERTGKFFGTTAMTFDDEREKAGLVNSIIIKKGAAIPCSVTKSYYTTHDGQTTVECDVTESATAETDPAFVSVMWKDDLRLPPDRPAEREVKVTFSYDENQIMHCLFLDVESGNKREVSLSMTQSKGEDGVHDIDEFIVE
ncbi:MAG: Hsp70 family protein [Gammaproteobacteria bacterium]